MGQEEEEPGIFSLVLHRFKQEKRDCARSPTFSANLILRVARSEPPHALPAMNKGLNRYGMCAALPDHVCCTTADGLIKCRLAFLCR